MRPLLALALAAGLTAFAPAPVAAQPARLLADISDRPLDDLEPFVLPPSAVLLHGVVYFAHDDGVAGQELWRSDGTEAGTWRVRDICPGRCRARISEITVVGDRIFFGAEDGVHGNELWRSDGTAAGTRLVADLAPGLRGSHPAWITAFGARVFFTADDGVHGREPWVSDGTGGGTDLLGDVQAGLSGSHPTDSVAIPGGVFFFAIDELAGREPWFTDGTAAGTRLLRDVLPGSGHSVFDGHPDLSSVVPFAGKAWFPAFDGVHGMELWSSDGTEAGTALAADLSPGAGSPNLQELMATSTRLYFRAHLPAVGEELFSTDGSSAGLVADLTPGPASSQPLLVGTLSEEIYFVADDGNVGRELWKSDGTAGGTVLVADLVPGAESGADAAWAWPALAAGDRLFFGNGPSLSDIELWRTDGTAEGTRLVVEIRPGDEAGLPFFFAPFAPPVDLAGRLFFFASHPELGWEPWVSDGSAAGTTLVRDIHATPSSQISFFFEYPDSSFPADAGGRLYFIGTDAETLQKPWTSRGTPQSTHRVEAAAPGSDDGSLFLWPVAPVGTRQLLSAHSELWATDESGEQMSVVADVGSVGFGSSFAGRAFFGVGSRLWVSDGTSGGTGPLIEEPPFASSLLAPLAVLDDRLYFVPTATFGSSAAGLWSTDGTAAGTSEVTDLTSGFISSPGLVASGARLFFPVVRPDTGVELWTSDGTEAGTVALPEVRPGEPSGFVNASLLALPANVALVPLSGGVAFVGDDGVRGEEPWWSDGLEVVPVGDLRPGARGSEPRWLTSTGDTLFFSADDGVHGRELWRWRPGEPAAMVADRVPGPGSSLPQETAGVDGVLYFSAFTPNRGVELWRSDGTAAGTMLVQDVQPGAESSTPSRLTVSGRYLYFTADDGVQGREMWSLLLPTRRPRVFLTSAESSMPERQVMLTLRLENPPPEQMPDGDGDELSLPLPAVLEVVEVSATSGEAGWSTGAAAAAAGTFAGPRAAAAAEIGSVVTWNGALPPGGAVEIMVVARVSGRAAASVTLQATGGFDSDGDGTNDEPLISDDPRLPGEDDATTLALPVDVPALAPGALVLLAAALALLALHRLRPAAG